MSQFVDFLEDMFHDRLGDIDITMIGKIEKFDKEAMRADVTPMMKRKSGEKEIEYSVLKDIPVNFILAGDYYIRPEYKAGDLVQLAFSTHDIAEALKDKKPLASDKIFSSENAFVVGGVAKTGWSAPKEFSESGMLIGHKEGGAIMQYTPDKIIMKFGEQNSIEFSATGMKVIMGGVAYDFVTHQHPTGVGPSGPPNPS